MKTEIFLIVCVLFFSAYVSGQINSGVLNNHYTANNNAMKDRMDSLSTDPNEWMLILGIIEDYVTKKDSMYGAWMNGLNVEFKTFQNQDSSQSSLGFSYDLNVERAKITTHGSYRKGQSISIASSGNLAFNKSVNPYNFLYTTISLNTFHTGGGVVIEASNTDLAHYANMRRQLASYENVEEILKSAEWKELNEKFVLKNSWIIKYDVNAGLESNQDFSMYQNTFGLRLGLGLKSWNANSMAAKWNVIDYPFEIIRELTGYDGNIHRGITIPSLMLGLDYVNPVHDMERESIVGSLKPYPRVSFEIGFRTVLTEVYNQTLYVNSSFKYFKEIGASALIERHNYSDFSYFTASLTTSSGLFVSYAFGKLPFDRQNDAVYEIGFRYRLE